MEAETSGGLLFSIGPDRADGVLATFRDAGEEAWEIGVVLAEPEVRVRV
jgi:hydrogenase maturation factor